eukprot:2430447-Alexandrium_andersonii.AAC.1
MWGPRASTCALPRMRVRRLTALWEGFHEEGVVTGWCGRRRGSGPRMLAGQVDVELGVRLL